MFKDNREAKALELKRVPQVRSKSTFVLVWLYPDECEVEESSDIIFDEILVDPLI